MSKMYLDFHAKKLDFEAKITLLTLKKYSFWNRFLRKNSINLDIYIFAKTFNFGTKIQNCLFDQNFSQIFGHTVIVPSENTQLFDKVDKPINQ